VDELPANMAFVAGTGVPVEPTVNGQTLVWDLTDVPLTGLVLEYRVRPLETGTWPTNVVAYGEGTDGLGQPGRVSFPVPEVVVIGPTATPTSSPTATPIPTPSATPTRGPTRPPEPIYLPVLRNDVCLTRRQHADVALVIDTSNSMLEPSGSRSKLEAAVDAARSFIGLLELDPSEGASDSAAIIAFNDEARILAPLSKDAGQLSRALDHLPQGPGTRIDFGLDRAGDALAGPGRDTANLPVVVLLTDGRPSAGATTETVMSSAEALRRGAVLVFAVGLGPDVDPQLLEQIAGDRARLLLAPTADDLARIYAAIARELPCATVP
jgi:Mg-chelatase subunit ChlD